MKKAFALIATIFLFASAQGQQVLNLLTGEVRNGSDAAKPVKTVETLEDGYLVTYSFTEVLLVKDELYSDCVFCCINGFLETDEIEYPAFPYKKVWVNVNESNPKVEMVESNFVDFNYKLSPARPPLPDESYYTFENVPPITPYSGFMPEKNVKELGILENQGRYRFGCCVYPIQYNYVQQIVRAYTKIVYKVTLSDSTTGIEELNTKEDMPTNGFTLDGRPVKGNVKSVIIQEGKKRIVR